METTEPAVMETDKRAKKGEKEAKKAEKETKKAEKEAKKAAKAAKRTTAHLLPGEVAKKASKAAKRARQLEQDAEAPSPAKKAKTDAQADKERAANRTARLAATAEYLRQRQVEQQRAEAERAAKKEEKAQRHEAKMKPKKKLSKPDQPQGVQTNTREMEVLAGDWACGVCGAHVFASKLTCFKCGAQKGEVADYGDFKNIDAICKDCSAAFVVTAREQFFFQQKGFGVCVRVRCTACTEAKKQRYGSNYGSGGSGGGGGDAAPFTSLRDAPSSRCFNCAQVGHLSRDCPKARKPTACYFCGEVGHISRSCPSAPAPGACFHCGQTGHISRNCPSGGAGQCFKCGGKGHMAKDCIAPSRYAQN